MKRLALLAVALLLLNGCGVLTGSNQECGSAILPYCTADMKRAYRENILCDQGNQEACVALALMRNGYAASQGDDQSQQVRDLRFEQQKLKNRMYWDEQEQFNKKMGWGF